MEVTLRKASALEKGLLTAARSLPLTKTVAVSIYGAKTVEQEVHGAQAKLSTNVERAIALTKTAFKIRQSIGDLNATSGIDSLLTEKAALDATEKLISTIVSAQAADMFGLEDEAESAVTTAQARLDAMQARAASSERSYGMQETVTVSVIGEELTTKLQDELNAIRLRKVAIADELLLLNMSRKISISAEAEALLKEFKLI